MEDDSLELFSSVEKELLKSTDLEKEHQVLELIRIRVSELLDRDPELLMSYLYRLDIAEDKLKKALSDKASVNIAEAFSQMIFVRQKERVETKKKFKQDPIEGWDNW